MGISGRIIGAFLLLHCLPGYSRGVSVGCRAKINSKNVLQRLGHLEGLRRFKHMSPISSPPSPLESVLSRTTSVRGVLDDINENELEKKKKGRANTRQATSREINELRERFQERKTRRRRKSSRSRRSAGESAGGGATASNTDEGVQDDDEDPTSSTNQEGATEGRKQVDMSKYVVVHKNDGGRLGVLKKIMYIENEKGDKKVNMGVFGKSAMHWYELWISGRPTSLEKNFEEQVENLPKSMNRKTNRPILRECTLWAPSKRVKTYNPDTDRKGSKTIRWQDGERVFVRLVLDNHAYDLIQQDKRIHGFVHTHQFEDSRIPYPAPPERVEDAETWLATDHDQTKEQVLREVEGRLVDSNREDHVDSISEWNPFNDVEDLKI
mmetsp:Transcript_1125/g.1553  ORF Transcript_1125/g.1553 Transcript_1125/m.1553 type:complete len:381 (-) Transcript_1125:228-1370(-)